MKLLLSAALVALAIAAPNPSTCDAEAALSNDEPSLSILDQQAALADMGEEVALSIPEAR
ncbi:hypothetical protein FQN49_008908, partial [Arthroderma sp. PD_2]